MSESSTPPPRVSLLAPWLALGAGLGALAILPEKDATTPAAAFSPSTTISTADPAISQMAITLAEAPSMTLPPPPPGPAIRFSIGAPSVAGFVRVATQADLDPMLLSAPAKIDRLFAVAGTQVKPLPEGYHHPLLSPEAAPAPRDEFARYRGPEPMYPEPTPEQWAELRWCESSGNYQVTNFSGKYRGAYQFDQKTWESVGGTGDPAAAAPAEQDKRAAILYATRGSSPWPYCGQYLDPDHIIK